ncbi:hypothetical protein TPA0906_19300 [Streptomyces olivaceus]|uniref:hypothetical protein n=1 Tax=Streptomyces olivaceus TaxID=47716 RepID=UPI0022EF068F|nr:hypothetical protein [Streptomyces olivaceus]GHJ00065.1 hypothetical protein TPA0906_19300 [Streptomyces olivaceus]
MGVFARLLRRSKTTEDASAAGTRAEATETERTADGPAEAAEPADAADPRTTGETDEPAPASEAAEPDGVGIPKQQSAGEAVDNEADKGART